MGRMHSKGKGISSSAIPYSRTAPSGLKTNPDQVVDQICKLAKKGATPSRIGENKDLPHPEVQRYDPTSSVKRSGAMNVQQWTPRPDLPEDLYMLIKKAVAVRKHLERNRKTRTPSSASFSSSRVSTVLPATTRPSVSCPPPGGTRAPLPAPSSLKR
ncbi:40S ribosomal protein S13 [Verticillium alfalfae VaMs.102]|uniref:40S ribosomal protein S13 n=1 Tax=Verticillium alfalfae (strain VaMs.102 / ATCC MYA-4576 / FGSC 10136) TaxID=526221 RepID=C9SLX6_VERA1|nr:40S ribosomal protein S13 [Verticillium alfalfae VaMs.102]EEY19791.1 40S ribosomal protein S13 [Verticillium alfalfae VaMs.102]